jgi:trimethylamine--corrinoid protein Co-methyltransferase
MSLVAQAPSEYTLHGRNPDRTVRIGGHNMVFAPTYGSPYILGLDGTRRYSTLEDLQTLLKLTHQQPALHLSGGVLCEPKA